MHSRPQKPTHSFLRHSHGNPDIFKVKDYRTHWPNSNFQNSCSLPNFDACSRRPCKNEETKQKKTKGKSQENLYFFLSQSFSPHFAQNQLKLRCNSLHASNAKYYLLQTHKNAPAAAPNLLRPIAYSARRNQLCVFGSMIHHHHRHHHHAQLRTLVSPNFTEHPVKLLTECDKKVLHSTPLHSPDPSPDVLTNIPRRSSFYVVLACSGDQLSPCVSSILSPATKTRRKVLSVLRKYHHRPHWCATWHLSNPPTPDFHRNTLVHLADVIPLFTMTSSPPHA